MNGLEYLILIRKKRDIEYYNMCSYNMYRSIYRGQVVRLFITVVILYILSLCRNNTNINKFLYLLLPILLSILDGIDNIFICFYNKDGKKTRCNKTYYYQYLDKISDIITYLIIFLLFGIDNIFIYIIFYRLLGIILFSFSKNSKWLILFFDFAKEYLLYLYVFGYNYIYLPFFIILKIIFEYFFHTIINSSNY